MSRSRVPAGGGLWVVAASALLAIGACGGGRSDLSITPAATVHPQVPTWSADDLEFFLHGSLGTEVVPERFFGAFATIYPDLYAGGVEGFGFVVDEDGKRVRGVSRKKVDHLGGEISLGLNCAACHYGVVEGADGSKHSILGMTGFFDPDRFLTAVIGSTILSQDPANMKRLLVALGAGEAAVAAQSDSIAAACADDPWAKKGAGPGSLHALTPADLAIDPGANADLARSTRNILKLFHNMRAALHVPEPPGAGPATPPGPGRNDAFGLLAKSFFHIDVPVAPSKYGLVWNVGQRKWVHWDGNNDAPIERNLAAALGLGAPLVDTQPILDFALVDRHTRITEEILPPKYPWPVDATRAARGASTFLARCAPCHVADDDSRLFDPRVVGTDPNRSRQIDARLERLFTQAIRGVEMAGYTPRTTGQAFRETHKYWASDLSGVWARSPYLHNGSVRTMAELLSPAARRAQSFRRGTRRFDPAAMGYEDSGAFVLETRRAGNSSAGHEYGTDLPDESKKDLIEYLKTL